MRRPAAQIGASARFAAAAALLLTVWGATDTAWAAGPFGVAAPEAGGGVAGGGLFGWIAAQQSAFYRALTGAVRAVRTDPAAAAALVGLSFLYGVFHAAGPGHGKAVIASYVVANGETLRRGILLSFVSAFLQALVAIAFVALATFVLNLTSLAITQATVAIEMASGVMISALGLWLVWTKVLRRRLPFATPALSPDLATAGAPGAGAGHVHGPDCRHAPRLMRSRLPTASGSFQATTAPAGPAATVCADCGHLHAPDPKDLAGPFSLGRAASAVVAVGIRPCTGALIVLVFAFSQKLFWAGILSTLAMAVGTGITVAVLASLAVSAKSLALRMAGADSPWAGRIVRGAEVIGATAVLALGLLLLGAALAGGTGGG